MTKMTMVGYLGNYDTSTPRQSSGYIKILLSKITPYIVGFFHVEQLQNTIHTEFYVSGTP